MIDEVARIITEARLGMALTGAGISAESGVPTFRGKDGLWNKFDPQQLASMAAFLASPELVWEWYEWRRGLIRDVTANPGHVALTRFPDFFNRFTLVTQNVDGLHQRAGSPQVMELHGNIMRNKCVDTDRPFVVDDDFQFDPKEPPRHPDTGGLIRPDVVWFGEMLPENTISRAFELAESCEVFFSIGTSALVQPAASIPMVAKQHGAILIEVNPEPSELAQIADFVLAEPAGVALPKIVNAVASSANSGVEEV